MSFAKTPPKNRRGRGRPAGRQYNFADLKGTKVGTLTVFEEAPSLNGNTRWRCRCECGAVVVLEGISIRERVKRLNADPKSSTACSRTCPKRKPSRPARRCPS